MQLVGLEIGGRSPKSPSHLPDTCQHGSFREGVHPKPETPRTSEQDNRRELGRGAHSHGARLANERGGRFGAIR